jgi:hypothetical protein
MWNRDKVGAKPDVSEGEEVTLENPLKIKIGTRREGYTLENIPVGGKIKVFSYYEKDKAYMPVTINGVHGQNREHFRARWGNKFGWVSKYDLEMARRAPVGAAAVPGSGAVSRDQVSRAAAVGPRRTVPLDQRPIGLHRLPHEIKFYERHDDFYEFTNFWECTGLMIDGKQWRTTEHYFQAQKFTAWPELVERCRNFETARECFAMVRDPLYKPFVREDWHRGWPNPGDTAIKDQVMYNAVTNKFKQDTVLRHLLESTAFGGVTYNFPRMLIEHTDKDDYWGDGGVDAWHHGMSGNKLGLLLMLIRGELLTNTIVQYPRVPAPDQLLHIQCPDNAIPGKNIRFKLPDDRTMEVMVPPGVSPGEMFKVRI